MVMDIYKTPVKIELMEKDLHVNGTMHPHAVRTLAQMSDVLRTASALSDRPLYYMYRAVYSRAPLRYDITYVPAAFIGSEYVKTYGHYHPIAPDGLAYPEAYQVLAGEALFLLQKKESHGISVLLVEAKEKEVVLFPPGYGHVSINPGKKDLLLANIVSDSFKSDYSEYKKNRGAACYYTTRGVVKNVLYKNTTVERISALDLNARYHFVSDDLLAELHSNPKKFEFLEKPSLLFRK